MPPKKDKKQRTQKKKLVGKKKIFLAEPPRFATGYNRQIPGGVFAGGGGIPASFIGAGYASRQPPPATPIQTPDQFSIIQQQQKLASSIADVQEEQKVARKERSDKGQKRGPRTPLETMTMTEQMKMQTTSMDMLPPDTSPPPAKADSNIRKTGRKKKTEVAGDIPASSFASPSVISSPEYPGGQNMFQQGMFLGTPAKLKGSPPDLSTDLDGVLDPIGEPAVFLG